MDKITPSEQKKLNRLNIYSFIYDNKKSSKQELANRLNLSLPTVTQNIQYLEEMDLIFKDGLYDSDGGRKAQIYSCNSIAKIAIGLEVFKHRVNAVALNLYGESLRIESIEMTYQNGDSYFKKLGEFVDTFSKSLKISDDHILGVGIAIQGLISEDSSTVIYGRVLDNAGITLHHFSQYINYPCMLIHDAKAAASAELWFQHLSNAVYIGLNQNIGGAVVINGQILRGLYGRGGAVEHMCLVPNGKICYCGRRGCMENYCSGNALEAETGMNLETFFENLRFGNKKCMNTWNNYLKNLAFSIDNIRFVVDSVIILGGEISSYMTENDFEVLYRNIPKAELCDINILPGNVGKYSCAIGAGIQYIKEFLNNLNI